MALLKQLDYRQLAYMKSYMSAEALVRKRQLHWLSFLNRLRSFG